MLDNIVKNNQALIIGEIVSGFTFSHSVFGEDFYMMDVMVKRLSDSVDIIPIMISERLINIKEDYIGKHVQIAGQFRSYNCYEKTKHRLKLSVFVREFNFEDNMVASDNNQIYLDGYICKPPVYRKTPLGKEVADLLIAVNRPYGKSDYIPCICWGRNARFVSSFEVGNHIQIWGRIQSREYTKRTDEKDFIKKVAYEISVRSLNEEADEALKQLLAGN